MFWNRAIHFSFMIAVNKPAPVPANTGRATDPSLVGGGNFAFANARALFKCVRATASSPPAPPFTFAVAFASARINSFSTYVTYGILALFPNRAGWHTNSDTVPAPGG